MPLSMPNPALQRLEVLVGQWKMESPQFPGAIERSTFEWLEGGAFLVQRTEIDDPKVPSSTIVIGRDEAANEYCALYFDSRGVSRIYQMSLSDGVWKMWREAPGFSQRFIGTFSDDGRTIRSRWEKSGDGSNWEHDFNLTYTKVK